MAGDEAFLSELGVTARGERDVARDVIRDAALAAAARAAASGRGACAGADASSAPASSPSPADVELARLREEADEVSAELAAVKDALEEARARRAEAPEDDDDGAALVVAVGERRVAGLEDKRAALDERVALATVAAAERRAVGRDPPPPPAPAPAAAVVAPREDDDLDALLDAVAAPRANRSRPRATDASTSAPLATTTSPPAAETERERLIRAGVLTPFDRLEGFERRANRDASAAADAAREANRAWTAGRSRVALLEGDDVPRQHPEARPFETRGNKNRAAAPDRGARMAAKRREWRAAADAALGDGDDAPRRRRRRRRGGDAAYSSDEDATANVGRDKRTSDKKAAVKREEGEGPPPSAEAPSALGRRRGRSEAAARTKPSAANESAAAAKTKPTKPKKSAAKWSCPACTFANPGPTRRCEVCETPREAAGPVSAGTFSVKREPEEEQPEPGGGSSLRTEDAGEGEDDEVVVVGEVPAPGRSRRERASRAKKAPTRAAAAAAPPPPREAAVKARRRAGRTAEAEASDDGGLSEPGSESDYEEEEEDEEEDDEEDEEEEEEVDDGAFAARGGTRRVPGGGGGTRGAGGGAVRSGATGSDARARSRARARPPGSSPPGVGVGVPGGFSVGDEKVPPASSGAPRASGSRGGSPASSSSPDEDSDDDEDVAFDGGLRLPARTYANLLEHQRTSVKWLWELHCQRAGGIVGDEMGLGKTVQVAAFLYALERSGLYRPSLVVCPATMLRQWRRELRAWAPTLRVTILHESAISANALSAARGSKTRAKLDALARCVGDPLGVLVTTYEHLRSHRDHLLAVRWGYAVLDEGHKIRNPDADVTICAKQLQTVHRLIMTGAPIQNRLSELWSLFDFCFPGKLGTLPVFQAQFAVPIQVGGYVNASQVQVMTAYRCATSLKDLISPFLLRRMKADVNVDLPAKTEQVLFCPMTSEQREAYRAYLNSRDVEDILEGRREALGGIDVLRKIVNHPDLLERTTRAAAPNYGEPHRSGKHLVTLKVLGLWREQGHRCLVFSQTQQMLDILEASVASAGYAYRRMDGSTPVNRRMRLIDEFNEDPRVFAFLLTTKTGGLGVNLTGADRVLLYDPDWNPSTDAQARERAWRIGQRKEVTVYRLVTAGTIEEKVYHRQIYKEFLTSKVLKDPKQRRFFKAKDLADLFSWDEGGPGGGGGGGGGDDAIETAELFADVEGEIKAADVRDDEEEEPPTHRDDEEDGPADADGAKDGEGASPGDDPDGDDAWDPNADPGANPRGEKSKRPAGSNASSSSRRRRFAIATVPDRAASASASGDASGDAAIMRHLFGGGGGGGGGGASSGPAGPEQPHHLIKGAMNHDAIMSAASGGRDHLAAGPRSAAALEAERVARRAREQVRLSSVQSRGAAPVSAPTWTGRAGIAGAPLSRLPAHAGRFGRAAMGEAGSDGDASLTKSLGAGVAGAFNGGAPGSGALLRRIRARGGGGGRGTAAAEEAPRGGGGGGDVDAEAESMLRDVCAFLRARPGRRAPTGLVVDAFQDRVGAGRERLFRRVLNVAATLERGAPDAAGGRGATWTLRPEFAQG